MAPLSTVSRTLKAMGLAVAPQGALFDYVEVLRDEKQGTTVGFLLMAVAWFNGQGKLNLQKSPLGQRHGLRLQALTHSLRSDETDAQENTALHAPHQWQSRAVRPPADCVYIKTLLAQ